jgi:hypothetical protein
VREVRTPIYTRFYSRVALAGLYGAVKGNARSGERHVTARAVTPLIKPTNASPYLLEPLNSNDTKAQIQGNEAGKEEKLLWTEEMLE